MSQSPEPPISRIAFTPAVKAAQEERGSRRAYARMEERGQQGPWQDSITPELEEFLAERDTLYLGTVSGEGQPYVQHRGGPRGFIKVLDDHTLALADYVGNAQYVSLGNLTENERASLFLMDYRHQQRIKIWGTARFVEDDEELLRTVTDTGYGARPERVLVFHVKAWSPNCTQYITQRFTQKKSRRPFRPFRTASLSSGSSCSRRGSSQPSARRACGSRSIVSSSARRAAGAVPRVNCLAEAQGPIRDVHSPRSELGTPRQPHSLHVSKQRLEAGLAPQALELGLVPRPGDRQGAAPGGRTLQ